MTRPSLNKTLNRVYGIIILLLLLLQRLLLPAQRGTVFSQPGDLFFQRIAACAVSIGRQRLVFG